MNLWPLLACAGIIALFTIVFVQQSWIKHRAIEAAHERATEQVEPEK
jgi:ribosomal protein L16/L10AE